MRSWTRSVLAYVFAAILVAGAALVTRLLRDAGDRSVFPVFIGAVATASWFGGLGPGLVATALSEVASAFFLLGPISSPAEARDHLLRVLVFTFIAALTASLHAATRRAEEEQHRARTAAESASAAKDKLLATVSHELRNPLNPIMLAASAMETDPRLPGDFLEDIVMIRRNVNLEMRLINDLLDVARFVTGKMNLKRAVVHLHQPLAAALDVCRQELEDKRISLKLERTSEDDLSLVGDADRLQQVFWNLLRNAIKFTPEGGRITVRAHRCDGNKVSVEVSDSGIGIDPDRLKVIFAAFEQGGTDVPARFGGLGLGLAICQAVCAAHGGTVIAESEGRGHGSTFTVTLPDLQTGRGDRGAFSADRLSLASQLPEACLPRRASG
jgi:signal transduction histidine kinase